MVEDGTDPVVAGTVLQAERVAIIARENTYRRNCVLFIRLGCAPFRCMDCFHENELPTDCDDDHAMHCSQKAHVSRPAATRRFVGSHVISTISTSKSVLRRFGSKHSTRGSSDRGGEPESLGI